MNITRGKVPGAIRIGIYGTEGVGKTTFAARLPGAVFIDTEGSTNHMDVARFDRPESLDDVFACVDYVIQNPDGIGTLVIDTVDWLEKFLFRWVCKEKGLKNIEDMGYGKGYVLAKTKLQELLEKLDQVIGKGVNVCLVCHSMIRKFEMPDEMGSYDRYMLKLNEKNIAPVVKEWVDMLLFVNYKTDIITDSDGKTKKGRGGQKRVMYANHNACWDAKNRFGLPDEMPFDFDQVAKLFQDAEPVKEIHVEPAPEPQKAPVVVSAPKAEVVKGDKVPEPTKPQNSPAASSQQKKKSVAISQRPESMKSENPDKDKLLEKLWANMCAANVPDPNCLQAVVAEKDYYDSSVMIKDYDIDFIDGCLIGAWESAVRGLCQTKYENLPF